MAKKKSKKSKKESSGLNDFLDKKQQKKLQDLADEMIGIASNVISEYDSLDLSSLTDLSSSLSDITQIHEDSPWLDETFKGDAWKKIIKNIPPVPKNLKDDDDTK